MDKKSFKMSGTNYFHKIFESCNLHSEFRLILFQKMVNIVAISAVAVENVELMFCLTFIVLTISNFSSNVVSVYVVAELELYQ